MPTARHPPALGWLWNWSVPRFRKFCVLLEEERFGFRKNPVLRAASLIWLFVTEGERNRQVVFTEMLSGRQYNTSLLYTAAIPCHRVAKEQPRGQLNNSPNFTQHDSSLSRSQVPAIDILSDPQEWSLTCNNIFQFILIILYTYTQVIWIAISYLLCFIHKFCKHFSFHSCVLHALSISPYRVWSFWCVLQAHK